ncbi:hypothetical protein GGS26DRAFT_587032 [Hypomontagnella submonticulosa]|nr:hypothetical protein GGS26DRAFT_587032 [Hypomontagnella submonticulosa]
MPPSNSRREPEDSRVWQKSPRMSRQLTLQPRSSWRDARSNSNSFANRRLRARLVTGRSPDGDDDDNGGRGRGRGGNDDDDGRGKGRGGGRDGGRDGGRGGGGDGNRDFRGFGDGLDDGKKSKDPDKPDDESDDSRRGKDDESDDDNDDDDKSTSNPPQPSAEPATPSSGTLVTMTAIPPPRQPTTPPGIVTASPSQLPSPSVPLQSSPTPNNGVKIPDPNSGDRKEEGDSNNIPPSSTMGTSTPIAPTPLPDLTETSTDTASATTSTISGNPAFSMGDNNNNNNNNNNDGGRHRGPGPGPGQWRGIGSKTNNSKGLDPTAEDLLIAAGAIGAFILFCFVGWIVYRASKRSKGGKLNGGKGMGFIDKLVWRRREPVRGTLDGRTLYLSNEAPPIYEKGEYVTSGTFYGPGKAYPAVPATVIRSVAGSETGTLEKLPNSDPVLVTVIDQYAPGNEDARSNGDVNLTMRSQVSQPYYTVSELNRQPTDTFNTAKRAGNRTSELSSISSGFGDGDIIIPPPLAVNKPLPVQEPGHLPARDSWISRNNSKRETVYTEASEDRPARFRSISSWVNQQAGRAKRAGSRARERGEVPVMPAIPGELSVTQQTVYR